MAGEVDDDSAGVTATELGTSFDNPNHIELPATSRPASAPIDTTTYCKRDKIPRNSAVASVSTAKNQSKPQILAGAVTSSPRNG